MTTITIKLCGLSTAETMEAAVDAGADLVALNFHPKSPRFVELPAAARLADQARGRAHLIALVVGLDDARMNDISAAVRPDWWQLHGQEGVDRAREIRTRFGLPIIKAIGWSSGDGPEYDEVLGFQHAVDRLLLDAKPPKDASYPGGHGRPFDWETLRALPPDLPFMLSGGLHPDNVADAIRRIRNMGLSLTGVDVSSGIESAPGCKDIAKIRDFVQAARAA